MDGITSALATISASSPPMASETDSPLAIAEYDRLGRLTAANKAFCRLMGCPVETMAEQSHGLISPEYRETCGSIDPVWDFITAHRISQGEYCRVNSAGQLIHVRASHVVARDDLGYISGVTEVSTDITSECLLRSELQSQNAAIRSSHAVVRFDMQGLVLDANAVFLDAMGYSLDEVRGHHHRMFVEPSHAHSADYPAFWSDLARGNHHEGTYRRIGKGGRELWLRATYAPVFAGGGSPNGIIKYATVVTQEKRQQAEHQGQIAAIHQSLCVVSFDLDGTILDANDNFLDVMGYHLADVRGQNHRMLVEEAVAESDTYRSFWTNLANGQHHAGEYKRVGRDGREVWLHATYNPILDLNGKPFKIFKYATVITDDKLRRTDYQGQIAAIWKSQGVISFDLEGRILDANPNFLRPLGYELDEVRGKHHRLFLEPGYAASADYAEFWARLRSGAYVSGLYKRLGKDGRIVWIQASYNPILDLNGKPFKVVKYASDVTENVALAEAYEDTRKQSQHDPATALPNRHRLLAFMRDVLAEPNQRLVVFYLDLDRFKPINDTYGHDAGDHVLAQVADRLRRALSREQIAARIGGDEFIIAAPDLNDDDIDMFGERLIDTVSCPIDYQGDKLTVGVSIGVATSQDACAPDELIRCADIALYRSKNNNRGCLSLYAASLHDRILAFRTLVSELRLGLERHEFFLEYQPRFHTEKRRVNSVEALVRWHHPKLGRLMPADFIPAAERSGVIKPLGAWVLRQACTDACLWPDIGVSVNVSPAQFVEDGLVHLVADTLAETGLDPKRLELEVTEGILLADAERARATLDALKRLGVRIAMDDFGSGYSSLSSLRSFPFDVIKIDRQFVTDMGSRQGGREVIQAILGLAHALRLSVTAEGVESDEQLEMLAADHCSEVQGYLLARPMGQAEITAFLSA